MDKQYPSINSSNLFFIAWRNLMSKQLRAFLTIFAIAIGVGAIFLLLSFGLGLQRLIVNQVVGNQTIKSIDVSTQNSKVVALTPTVFDKIKNLPHISRIGAGHLMAGSLEANGSSVDSIVYGADGNYLALSNLEIIAGRSLKSSDNRSVVINKTVMTAIGIKSADKAVGKTVKLRIPLPNQKNKVIDQKFEIVGVSNDENGSSIFIPGGILVANGVKDYTQIKVEANNSEDVRALRSQIETLGLQTASPIDTVDQINQVFQLFNVLLAGFGAIGMIVAILGMFNTLTISLLERTKEIGLMIALGGRHSDMRKLFIFESVLLSFIGGAIGVIGATALGQITNAGMNMFSRHGGVSEGFQLFAVPWWLVVGMMVFMLLVGLVVVFIPARRAARINPIEALRRE